MAKAENIPRAGAIIASLEYDILLQNNAPRQRALKELKWQF
ncbi:hypothetical protein [Devosia sp.]